MPICRRNLMMNLKIMLNLRVLFLEKTCGSLPLVFNSEVIQPDRTTNETIQYICQDGFHLRGSMILKCISSQWQPEPPICERRCFGFLWNFK
jgi:hypothetical protein